MSSPLTQPKSELDKVVDLALKEGPQIVTRDGNETAVVLSMDEYRELMGEDFKRLLMSAPLDGVPLERIKGKPRPVDL